MRPAGKPASAGGDLTLLPAADGCGLDSASELIGCVEGARVEADVRRLAAISAEESPEAVRELCSQRFAELGLDVEQQNYGDGTNVLAIRPGFSKPAELVVVSAHHDRMVGCSGADDNLSGVAALLEIARVALSARFDRTLLFACWDEQEKGQRGSLAFAQAARARGDRIVASVVLDALGYASSEPESQRIPKDFEQAFPDQALRLLDDEYRGNFLTVVSGKGSAAGAAALAARGKEVGVRVELLELTIRQQDKLGELHRSDHVSFWAADYPALLVTDTGTFRNPHFHCAEGDDAPDTLDYDFLARATQAVLGATADLAELR